MIERWARAVALLGAFGLLADGVAEAFIVGGLVGFALLPLFVWYGEK